MSVHDIRKRVVPALDDEFAKDLGEFETLDALQGRACARTSKPRRARRRSARCAPTCSRSWPARVPFPVPASLVDREVDRRVEDFARRLIDQRIDPRKTNIDWAAFRERSASRPAKRSASALVLDEIARRDDIGVSEAEIDAELEKYSARIGLTVPAVRARLEQEGGLGRLAAGLRREKALARRDGSRPRIVRNLRSENVR